MILKRESIELLKAWLATSVAFGILLYKAGNPVIFSIIVACLTVGLGFIGHEICHRSAAKHFKKHAEFRANNTMLMVAIVMSFFGFIIAAPGAVWIAGSVSKKEHGMIAAAGPLANITISLVFIPLLFIMPKAALYGLMINSLLAVFNLIPFPGFDGEKVFAWHKPAYFGMAAIAVALYLSSYVLPGIIGI